jgi:hypothetical protein
LEDKVFLVLRKVWPDFTRAWSGGTEQQRTWVEAMQEKVSKGNIYPDYPEKEGPPPAPSLDEFEDIPF